MRRADRRTGRAAFALLAGILALACGGHRDQPRAPRQPQATRAGTPQPAPAPARDRAQPAAPAREHAQSAAPARALVTVGVADLAGDPEGRVKRRVLAHLRALAAESTAPGSASAELAVLDVPGPVLALADVEGAGPFEIVQEGHARARAVLAEAGAGALIWGTAPPGAALLLYLSTAESSDPACPPDQRGHAPAATAPPDAEPSVRNTGSMLCSLDTGATWHLCTTPWASLVPAACAPEP